MLGGRFLGRESQVRSVQWHTPVLKRTTMHSPRNPFLALNVFQHDSFDSRVEPAGTCLNVPFVNWRHPFFRFLTPFYRQVIHEKKEYIMKRSMLEPSEFTTGSTWNCAPQTAPLSGTETPAGLFDCMICFERCRGELRRCQHEKCPYVAHARCLQHIPSKQSVFCPDHARCRICFKDDEAERMLLCEVCSVGEHRVVGGCGNELVEKDQVYFEMKDKPWFCSLRCKNMFENKNTPVKRAREESDPEEEWAPRAKFVRSASVHTIYFAVSKDDEDGEDEDSVGEVNQA